MKIKLLRRVKTDFFCDDATGSYGIAHSNTIQAKDGKDGFNAFWDGRGFHHECMEHAHEHSAPFTGDAAMNIGGEIAAMGAMFYFIDALYVTKRLFNSFRSPSAITIDGTIGLIQEAIEDGHMPFGDTLVSNVGEIKEKEEGEFSEIDLISEDYFRQVKGFKPDYRGDEKYAADEIMLRERFRASVTLEKIKNLHRWGYRSAQEFAPINYENGHILNEFISFWDKFTKENDAEKLANYFRGITFYFFQKENGSIFWRAVLRGGIDVKSIVLNQGSRFHLEDCIFYGENT